MGIDPTPTPETEPSESSAITIKLEGFEGPLDLLLHLIKREEIDIWNIPIARVTEQYLEYIQIVTELNINLAGEWLLMAATLIHIKSRMLLPPDPVLPGEEVPPEDPRKELVYQLLEHQKFKSAAQMLYTREEVENSVWNNPPKEILEEGRDVVSVTLFDLLKAFHTIVKRFEEEHLLEMSQDEISVDEKIAEIRQLLLVRDSILFSAFFAHARSKHHLIVTFLALLELVRLHEIWIYQRQAFEEIHISKAKPAGSET